MVRVIIQLLDEDNILEENFRARCESSEKHQEMYAVLTPQHVF